MDIETKEIKSGPSTEHKDDEVKSGSRQSDKDDYTESRQE
jgi:hypothetical protein